MTVTLNSGSGYKDLPLFHSKKFVLTVINAGYKRKGKKRETSSICNAKAPICCNFSSFSFTSMENTKKKIVLFDISSAIMEREMKLMEMQAGVS